MATTRKKLIHFLRADPASLSPAAYSSSALSSPRSFSSNDSSVSDDDASSSSTSSFPPSASSSPSRYSPPPKSPWSSTAHLIPGLGTSDDPTATGLIASLVKERGKVYSLAAAGDLLYTGTDSETVRVWRDRRDLAALRAGSGLVKAIVISADGRIFTGHQDGKIRVWRRSSSVSSDPATHRRLGSLPALGDYLASSVNPSSYVSTGRRRRRRAVWLRHTDAVSCLSLDEEAGILYSGSWDRTFKAWRVADSRCLESVPAHDDAVNTVAAAGIGGLVLTGSADGTVKVWRREVVAVAGGGERTRHVLERVLREGGDGGAVTAVAACPEARAVYVGTSDGLVTCWRWGVDGEPRRAGVLAGHRMGVMCLAVSGRVVVSGSADRTLCVWRRDDDGHEGGDKHVRLAMLAGHTGPVKCVAVAAEDGGYDDGERRFVLYSGSLDGSVKVWRLSEDRPLEPPPAAVTEAAVPSMPVLLESDAWTALPSPPAKAWAPQPELKRVAAA